MIFDYKIAALCTSDVSDDSSREYITYLSESLRPLGFRLFVYCTNTDLYWNTPTDSGEKAIFDLVDFDKTELLVIHDEKIKNDEIKSKLIENAQSHNVPVIILGAERDGCFNVDFDYSEGFRSIIEHVIIDHKATDIYLLSGQKGNDFALTREKVFRDVLAEHNIPFDDSKLYYGDFWSMPAAEAAEKIIASGHIPQALVCANDSMAIAACAVFVAHGYKVPEDIIITGFDGIQETKFSVPKITSCGCHYSDVADETAHVADQFFKGILPEKSSYITPRIILQESCGCCKFDQFSSASYFSTISNAFTRFKGEERVLYVMSSKAQICHDINELSKELRIPEIYNCCCLLKKESIDDTVNPTSLNEEDPYGDELIVLFDADYQENFKPYEFNRKDIIPYLYNHLIDGHPLIFAPINYNNVPLGYMCFHFYNYDGQNYNKVSQTINILNNTIGGFRNMRYQRFLRQQIEDMYKFDVLTGLYNRNGFMKIYKKLAEKSASQNGQLTAVLADLDGLKHINDTFGHVEGDNAISVAANALKTACDGAVCCRLGGDELIAVYTHVENAEKIRTRFHSFIDVYNASSEKPYTVSASVGIFTGTASDFVNFDKLFKNADELMYAEKSEKKQSRK